MRPGHSHFLAILLIAACSTADASTLANTIAGGEDVRGDMVKMANEVLAFVEKYTK